MARLKALPSLEIIRGFKGVIDFYVHRGLPCARAWPRYMPAHRSAPAIAAAALFGQILQAYRFLAPEALALFQQDALDQPRTPRDLYVSAVLGHLHEASMSDFLTLLQEARDFLENLTALLAALETIGTDAFQANVLTSALPDGAATLAQQQTQTTSLQTIDDLAAALQSVATNRLQVRGSDQLISYQAPLGNAVTTTISGANGYIDSPTVPPGQAWFVTTLVTLNATTACTQILAYVRHDSALYQFHDEKKAFAPQDRSAWSGLTHLQTNDRIRVVFIGALPNDSCSLYLTGHIMTKET